MIRHCAIPFLLALLTAGADIPEAYQVIISRDVFNPRRDPGALRASHATPVAPVIPPDRLTLLGVAVVDSRATALFAGSTPELTGSRRPGETLGSGRVVSIDTDGVTFEADAVSTLRIRVGQTVTRSGASPWQVSDSLPAAGPAPVAPLTPTQPAGPAAESTVPPPAGAATPGDILQRLLERRKRELAP